MKQFWTELFKPWILDRGQEYFEDQRVKDLKINDDEITAYVEGNEDYQVAIKLDNNIPIELYCSCPYAESGECCKHMAAVLFAVDDSTGIPQSQTLPDSFEWQTAIDHLPVEVLRTLIRKWAEKNPQFQRELALLCTGTLPSDIRNTWKNDLQAMIDDVSDHHGFVSYRDAYDLMCDISDYMEDQLDILLDSGFLMDAFELVHSVFTIADGIDMDDSDGGLYMLFNECGDAWQKIVHFASDLQQTELYQRFTECLNRSEWIFGQDEFESLFFSLHWNETLLRKNLNLVDRIIADHKYEDNYQLFRYLSFKEDILHRLGASDCEIITFWKEYFHLSHARNRLLDIYMTCDLDAAINLLCECKKLDQESLPLMTHHSEKLIELYQSKNMQNELKKELQFLIFKCKTIKTSYLEMLKELSSSEEWPNFVQQLLTLPLWSHERFIILHFEQLYQQLLDEIVIRQDFVEFKRYENVLFNWSPEQTCKCYIAFLKSQMYAASNRKQYWSVIQYLPNLFKYPNGNQVVSEIVQYWRTQHNNRPAMKDELEKAGF